MADLCICYHNSGSGKITNIKPDVSMDRFTWRSVKVKFWSAKFQNNAPLYNFTAKMKVYETLPPQLDPLKIDNAGSKQGVITPTVYVEVVNRVETRLRNYCYYTNYELRRCLTIKKVSC